MGWAAKKPCRKLGCPELVQSGYCEKHAPEKSHNWQSDRFRGNRHDRGYGRAWEKIRKRIFKRDRGLCQPCLKRGYVTAAREVDHIKPKEQGGSDNDDNLQSICIPCHRKKTGSENKKSEEI